jgi:hypothetical protein
MEYSSWVYLMGENAVLEKSFDFAVRMVALNRYLVEKRMEFMLSDQMLIPLSKRS